MAESVFALGIATNIIQFIDFGSKVTSTSFQMRTSHSANTQKNQELELFTLSLHKISDNLTINLDSEPEQRRTPNQVQIQQLAAQCKDACHELSLALDQLRGRDQPGKRQSFFIALSLYGTRKRLRNCKEESSNSGNNSSCRCLFLSGRTVPLA